MVIYFSQLKWVQRPRSRCQHGCVWAKAPFFLGNRHLLPCSHLVEWMRGLYRISFIRTLISFIRASASWPNTSQWPHFLIGLRWVSTWILGGCKHSVHSRRKWVLSISSCHMNVRNSNMEIHVRVYLVPKRKVK